MSMNTSISWSINFNTNTHKIDHGKINQTTNKTYALIKQKQLGFIIEFSTYDQKV